MTVELTYDIDGADRIIAGLEIAPAVLEVAKTEAMTKSVFLLEGAVKARTPRVTGRLFASINGVVGVAPALQGRVSTSVRYAPWVEGGRGPITATHMTASGKPGYLRFRSADGWVFRRTVGPAAGRFMFREGLAASKPAIFQIFKDAMAKVAAVIRGAH